jgi:ketosteroid isomerase-like protein
VSRENVEIVRGLYEAFARRDNESPFEVFDEEIEWEVREFAATGIGSSYRGHEGVRTFWRRWLEAWSELDFDYELADLGGDRVAGLITRQRNHGRGSGIWVEQEPYAQIWTLLRGKVVRMEYAELDEARRLAEAAPQPD